jgi:transcriptional enhancer factor
MSKEDMSSKRRHVSAHLGHLRSRHQPSSKYDFSSGGDTLWQGRGSFSSCRTNMKGSNGLDSETPYAVSHFGIVIHDEKKECIQRVTQLVDNGRMGDINVTDISSWYKQYPELSVHDTDELSERHVLVCDASIKIMTEKPRGSELSIVYVIEGQNNLDALEPLQCRTRFYDSGELADQSDKQGQTSKETTSTCDYASERKRGIKFGSQFWVDRMRSLRRELLIARDHEEQSMRSKIELEVRRSLQYLTARQDIYGMDSKTGEEVCVLTILWRFHQTRTANEQGKMTWRVVNFPAPPVHAQQPPWIKSEEYSATKDLKMIVHSPITTSSSYPPTSTYPSFSFDESYHQAFSHPPPLDLDSLAHIPPEDLNAFSNPTSATAPSMTTDYSQTHSLPSLTHLQDHTHPFPDANDIDFIGGHINLHLEPAINFGEYEGYGAHSQDHALAHMSSIAGGLEQVNVHSEANAFGDLNVDGSLLATCYPTKPWQHYNELISRFERAAEHQTHDLLQSDQHMDHNHSHNQSSADVVGHNQDLVAHGLPHDGEHLGQGGGLWKLQTPFGDDVSTGVGAGEEQGRRDSHVGVGSGAGHGQGIL